MNPKRSVNDLPSEIFYLMDYHIQSVANQLSAHRQHLPHSASPLGGLRISQARGELLQSQSLINGSCPRKVGGKGASLPREASTDEKYSKYDQKTVEYTPGSPTKHLPSMAHQ
jgi:hypothetical protein